MPPSLHEQANCACVEYHDITAGNKWGNLYHQTQQDESVSSATDSAKKNIANEPWTGGQLLLPIDTHLSLLPVLERIGSLGYFL